MLEFVRTTFGDPAMPTLLVLFNLKPGTSITDYEQWARERDLPTVRALPSIAAFDVLKVQGLLGTNARAPYEYAEIIQVKDMAAFGQDIASDAVQAGAKQFQAFADNPIFMLCHSLEA
jgi:hypothetical protein